MGPVCNESNKTEIPVESLLTSRLIHCHGLRRSNEPRGKETAEAQRVTVPRVMRPGKHTPVADLTVRDLCGFAVGDRGPPMHNTSGSSDPNRAAKDVLPGSLRREFPSQYLDKSLNEIKDMLRVAKGNEKRALQKAKKLLEQQERLMGD